MTSVWGSEFKVYTRRLFPPASVLWWQSFGIPTNIAFLIFIEPSPVYPPVNLDIWSDELNHMHPQSHHAPAINSIAPYPCSALNPPTTDLCPHDNILFPAYQSSPQFKEVYQTRLRACSQGCSFLPLHVEITALPTAVIVRCTSRFAPDIISSRKPVDGSR